MATAKKLSFVASMLVVLLTAASAAIADTDAASADTMAVSALYSGATLVRNTETCGDGVLCEAIFTIDSAGEKTLRRDSDILISFETQQRVSFSAIPFTYDYEIGTLQNVSRPVTRVTCTNGSVLPNGTVEPTCTQISDMVVSEEIVYHGKYLKSGTNYIRIWSNDKPGNLWVDWQMLIRGVPTGKQNIDFDTHAKGWAVWGPTSPPWSPITSYWSLDQAPYNDSSGHYANATVTGTAPGNATGIIGNAATFSSDTRINMSPNGILGSQARSVSVWVYPTNTTGGVVTSWGTRLAGQWFFIALYPGDANWAIDVEYYGRGVMCGNAVMPIPLNRWSHIVVTYPQGGQSSDTKVYLNGTLVTGCTNNTVGPVDTVDGGNPYTLGNRNYGSNEPFSGLLDEVAIYNRTLNATEVGLLYNNGAPLAYGYVAGPAIANESIGRQAILQGIQSSSVGSSFTAAYDRQVYTSIANGSQYNGRFDLFVQSGNKRWAFNYDQNTTASFPVFVNITPVFYVWQMANMPNATIVGSVSSFINSTN